MVVSVSHSMAVAASTESTSPWFPLDPNGGDAYIYVTKTDKHHRYRIEKTLQNPMSNSSPQKIAFKSISASSSALATSFVIGAPVYGFRYVSEGLANASASTLAITALQGDNPRLPSYTSGSYIINTEALTVNSTTSANTRTITKYSMTDQTQSFSIPLARWPLNSTCVFNAIGSFRNASNDYRSVNVKILIDGSQICDHGTGQVLNENTTQLIRLTIYMTRTSPTNCFVRVVAFIGRNTDDTGSVSTKIGGLANTGGVGLTSEMCAYAVPISSTDSVPLLVDMYYGSNTPTTIYFRELILPV